MKHVQGYREGEGVKGCPDRLHEGTLLSFIHQSAGLARCAAHMHRSHMCMCDSRERRRSR